MWGERGLISTFFCDLYRLNNLQVMKQFLRESQFSAPFLADEEPLEEVLFIIEPDFSNTGFGHPDAVFVVKCKSQRAVFIVEAKRVNFKLACRHASQRGKDGFNSTLNGQLELDFCLAMALSEFRDNDKELREPEWVLSTSYNADRQGRVRSLKNPEVLKKVVSKFAGEDLNLDNYYYLVITTNQENPLDDIRHKNLFPQLFKPKLTGIHMTHSNCWAEYRKQFGWINYEKMETFIAGVQDQLPLGSLFLPTYKLNKENIPREPNVEHDEDITPKDPGGIIDGNNILKDFSMLWEDSPGFLSIPRKVGCRAEYKKQPCLWVYPKRFEIAPKGKGNRQFDALCKIQRRHFSEIRGRARVYFNSSDFTWEKFEAFVIEVKKYVSTI